MFEIINRNFDYNRPVEISDGVYWVGFNDKNTNLHCNPYIIIDGEEAVVIDGGCRPDFPEIFMKIMQTGIDPYNIRALIYQHYDPDICGSVSNFEDIIEEKALKIISDSDSITYINHYGVSSEILSIKDINFEYKFSSGRTLLFFNTPYSHSSGSIITYDTKSRILFSSDIFGSFNYKWNLLLNLKNECKKCKTIKDLKNCYINEKNCEVFGIVDFAVKIMTSNNALRYALGMIRQIPAEIIAPQHGSIIYKKEDIDYLIELLFSLDNIGIDNNIYQNVNNISERLGNYEI